VAETADGQLEQSPLVTEGLMQEQDPFRHLTG
jgi:hypothetical protein